MTFIQPNKPKSLITIVIAGLSLAAFTGTFWLVVAYNQTVNLSHNIAAAKAELDSIGAENTAVSNQLVASMSSDQAAVIAAHDGLVQENKPQYVTIKNKQWPIVSR
jgi:cell division protein FtsB